MLECRVDIRLAERMGLTRGPQASKAAPHLLEALKRGQIELDGEHAVDAADEGSVAILVRVEPRALGLDAPDRVHDLVAPNRAAPARGLRIDEGFDTRHGS